MPGRVSATGPATVMDVPFHLWSPASLPAPGAEQVEE